MEKTSGGSFARSIRKKAEDEEDLGHDANCAKLRRATGFSPGLNGTNIMAIWDVFCPAGAIGFSPGFQPWEISKKIASP
jgi:hypothetical protein